jgi:hypothetical protein
MKNQIVRICLVVTMAAACAVSGVNLLKTRQKITGLQTGLQTQTVARQRAENELRGTQKELQATVASLAETKAAMEMAAAEKLKASEEAAAQTKRSAQLEHELQRTVAQRDAALDELAPFRTANLTAEEALNASKQLKWLQETVAAREAENRSLLRRIERYEVCERRLPAGLMGKVLVSDPKWQFVVLDVGETAGMIAHAELLVSRQGKLVGKVKVSRVEKERAIANVLPGWGIGHVTEGDVVIPANPEG